MKKSVTRRARRKLLVFWLRRLAWSLGTPGPYEASSGAYDPFDCWLNW